MPTRDQLLDAWGNALGLLSGATHAAFVASECMQVRGRLVVQLQRPSQRIKYLWGGVAIPTLLKANVVVGAHTRQQRELVAAQPGNTSAADVRDPGTLGRDQLATGPEILAKRVAGLHPHTITPRDVRVALPLPRLRGPLATPPSAREPVGMTSITTPITTPFKFHSTAAEVLADVDLSGKRAIVTGAASGIGVETARALAGAGADVTLAVRNPQAGADIAAEITASTGNPAVHAAQLELTNPSSIYRFVGSWRGPLHILVNNAGVMASPEARTDDGWESQFATNHLGHFALALGLQPALAAAEGARIVAVSSSGHLRSPVVFDDINFRFRPYDPLLAYGQSKTANVLFAARRQRAGARTASTRTRSIPAPSKPTSSDTSAGRS